MFKTSLGFVGGGEGWGEREREREGERERTLYVLVNKIMANVDLSVTIDGKQNKTTLNLLRNDSVHNAV